MKTGRRSFLKGVGGATAAALALPREGAEAGVPPAPRPIVGSRQVLELDGQIVGAPHSAEGGGASANILETLDSGLVVRKDVAGVHYEALSLEVGLGMSPEFYKWVGAFANRDFTRKNGALILADFNYNEVARREFAEAIITEVGFPALDGASKDPAFLTVKVQPEFSEFNIGKGGKVQPPASVKAKNWLASGFRVAIEGLEEATKRVSKVDAFAVKLKTVDDIGETRFDPTMYLDISNIVLTVPMADSQPFFDWFEDFVIMGNSSPESEKSGAILCLAPNGKTEILRVNLSQVGIVSIGESKKGASSDAIKRFDVELYVEEIEFDFKGGIT